MTFGHCASFAMIYIMRFWFLVVCFLFSSNLVQAYQLQVTEIDNPYEVTIIDDDILVKQVFLGELNEAPLMYEFNLVATTTFTFQLSQLHQGIKEPILFSSILVRQNDKGGGVSEIIRFNTATDSWKRYKDSQLGLILWITDEFNQMLGPGVYRFEISTPNNVGRFRLMIGDEFGMERGYLERLKQIFITQRFFGLSVINLLKSSYIYYPVTIGFILFVFYKINHFRRKLFYVD